MAEEENIPIAELIASLGSGSIIAAAGCGKTEQVALATKAGNGRRLILTHTHAGVDAITQRLKEHGVPRSRYRIDTIAGWCLRYAASFPQRAGLSIREPKRNEDWQAVYRAADQLIRMGAVDRVLEASYVGVLVDEYQDCNADQHAVIASIAKRLPVCVFGDHLQAIFDFGGQRPVDWVADVFPTFPEVARLTKPWRWHKAGNTDLANWLEQVRTNLEQGRALDFRTRPC